MMKQALLAFGLLLSASAQADYAEIVSVNCEKPRSAAEWKVCETTLALDCEDTVRTAVVNFYKFFEDADVEVMSMEEVAPKRFDVNFIYKGQRVEIVYKARARVLRSNVSCALGTLNQFD
jgi:hypothetical protein